MSTTPGQVPLLQLPDSGCENCDLRDQVTLWEMFCRRLKVQG